MSLVTIVHKTHLLINERLSLLVARHALKISAIMFEHISFSSRGCRPLSHGTAQSRVNRQGFIHFRYAIGRVFEQHCQKM
jgi:hypothetical protein